MCVIHCSFSFRSANRICAKTKMIRGTHVKYGKSESFSGNAFLFCPLSHLLHSYVDSVYFGNHNSNHGFFTKIVRVDDFFFGHTLRSVVVIVAASLLPLLPMLESFDTTAPFLA